MDIPKKLKDLLIREAHLKFTREAITPVLAEQADALAALQAAKPGLFAGKAAKEDHARQVAELRETVQLYRNGLAQLDRVEPHIARMVHEAGEDYARGAHPVYLRALAVRSSRTDWEQCLQRFAEKVYAFTQALGNVRNMACSGYSRDQQSYSQAAVQAFMLAISAGRKVEDEIQFANKIADIQGRLLAENGVRAVALPQLREVAYSQWVALISNMPLSEAQRQFDQIINEAKQLYDEGIPQLQQQAGLALENQEEALQGFVEKELELMRLAIMPEINLEEAEQSVADSEHLLNEMARQSVLGRLPSLG